MCYDDQNSIIKTDHVRLKWGAAVKFKQSAYPIMGDALNADFEDEWWESFDPTHKLHAYTPATGK